MQQYWDCAASESAYGSVMTAKKDWDKDEYYAEGKKHVEELVIPFLQKHNIQHANEKTIVDIGCGTGRMSVFLREIFGKVIGTDVSAEMIQKAKEDHAHTDIRFLATSGSDLKDIPSDTADIVFSYATLQHVNTLSSLESNLKEIFRILKTGGRMKVEVRGEPGNPAGKVVWFMTTEHYYLALVLWRNIIPLPFFRRFTPLYGVCLTQKHFKKMLENIGFTEVELYTPGNRHLWAEARK